MADKTRVTSFIGGTLIRENPRRISSATSASRLRNPRPTWGANFLNCKIFPLGKTSHEYTGCLATIPAMVSKRRKGRKSEFLAGIQSLVASGLRFRHHFDVTILLEDTKGS